MNVLVLVTGYNLGKSLIKYNEYLLYTILGTDDILVSKNLKVPTFMKLTG